MSGATFNLPDMNVDGVNTEISGAFFHAAQKPALSDETDKTLEFNISQEKLNKIFLFYSDDSGSGEVTGGGEDDPSDASNTDLKYAFHNLAWNLATYNYKIDRKKVIEHLLRDLFGSEASEALANIDVFSNESALDTDIANIFEYRMSQAQREYITDNSSVHGSFRFARPLDELSANIGEWLDGTAATLAALLSDISSSNPGALTSKLLEQAALHARSAEGSGSDVLRRQFDLSNTSNADLNLPTGWRTFQFADGDKIQYNLTITQPANFLPAWASNDGTPTATTYRMILNVKNPSEDPSTGWETSTVFPDRLAELYNPANYANGTEGGGYGYSELN